MNEGAIMYNHIYSLYIPSKYKIQYSNLINHVRNILFPYGPDSFMDCFCFIFLLQYDVI